MMITCLIVDDLEENRYILEVLLRRNGYEIMTACNGAEALEKARANLPDIIISDILMPVMDGYSLCKIWKADKQLKHIPFVFFTGTYLEPQDEEFGSKLGAERFIFKPMKPEILMNILKEVLEERYVVKQVATKPLGEEMEFFRRHDEILFKKLEKKMSDLKIANQKLRISEEELRLESEILAHIVESVHLVRVEDEIIVYTNERFDSVFGYGPGELVGKHVSIINAPGEKSPEAVASEITNSLKQAGGVWSGEVQNIRKDGRALWCYANVSTFKHPQYGNVWISVNRDITEQKRAEDELRVSQLQLRALATRLQQIREEEMTMIAREIHDEMGGGLTGLKMDLAWLLRKMSDAVPGEERVALMDRIKTANALIEQMIRVVRRISTDLRPSILDDLGLIAALEWQLSEFTSRTEIPHEFATTCEYVNLEGDTAIAVFRIFQEALTNVVRHAGATKVAVVLREGERSLFGDENLVLEIRDNGRGITEEEILHPESLGLLGMKERVLAFGGELVISVEPGGGTALILKIPRKHGEAS